MINLVSFENKKVLVTGASSGIGRQTAITLSRLGAEVVLVARREKQLRETLSMLEGQNHSIYPADLGTLDDIDALIKRIVNEHGPLDGMVYAAGIDKHAPLARLKPENMQMMFDTNFFGFVQCVRQVCKKGRYNKGMRIVGISSVASYCGDKAHTTYCSTKAAMDSAVRCMAKEVADKGICINTVAPGVTNTDLYQEILETYGEDSESMKDLRERQPVGIAETQDIANGIAFLLSSAASFITGTCMPIDGGYISNGI